MSFVNYLIDLIYVLRQYYPYYLVVIRVVLFDGIVVIYFRFVRYACLFSIY